MKNALIILLALFLTNCSNKITATNIADTKWKLTEWPEHKLPTTAAATLEFRPNNGVGGKSFCNGYGGSYTLTGNKIAFGTLMGTKMWCEEVGAAENDYLSTIGKVNSIQIKNEKLHLLQDEKTLLIFSKSE